MIAPGDALPSRTLTVRPAAMAVLAEVLHDPNPIHLYPAAAEAAGLGPRVINQGPANLAYIIDMLAQAFPGHRLLSLESRYLANVCGGDEVEAGGQVTAAEGDTVRCDAWLKIVPGDRVAVSASATLIRRR